jgi:hypothetical protein
MPKEWWEDECHAEDTSTLDAKSNSRIMRYENHVPLAMFDRVYSDEEKRWLRPICETLAMLRGNGFFGTKLPDGKDWYEQWLPDAAAIFYGNGGKAGWPSETSWMRDMEHETPGIKQAYDSWRTLKTLTNQE